MRSIIRLSAIFLLTLLSACESTTFSFVDKFHLQSNLYLDEHFPSMNHYRIESEEEIFAIDDEMRAMVNEKLLVIRDEKKRAKTLLRHIFSKENIDLAYSSDANLTAIQTYHNQAANCMSLTIMAYALANAADLNVKFQDVKVPEYWVRNDAYNMLTGHVNLVITKKTDPYVLLTYKKELLEIDFDPLIYRKSFSKKVVGRNTVLAMFYNNKGAQALASKNYGLAYAYLKHATLADDAFSPAWGNLSVLYRLNHHYDTALLGYKHAIALDNSNLTALKNYSFLLKKIGELDKALIIESQLKSIRNKNPYYHALLADEAFYRGDNELAITHYKKAIKMDKNVHEFYFGIAKVYVDNNDKQNAEKYMKRALVHNRVPVIESRYTAKLNFIRQASF